MKRRNVASNNINPTDYIFIHSKKRITPYADRKNPQTNGGNKMTENKKWALQCDILGGTTLEAPTNGVKPMPILTKNPIGPQFHTHLVTKTVPGTPAVAVYLSLASLFSDKNPANSSWQRPLFVTTHRGNHVH